VVRDLEILKILRNKNSIKIKYKIYTDEEEKVISIRYLLYSTAIKEPFTKVISNPEKEI
jgi:hypothetical protein